MTNGEGQSRLLLWNFGVLHFSVRPACRQAGILRFTDNAAHFVR
jgi:hypothetical protein